MNRLDFLRATLLALFVAMGVKWKGYFLDDGFQYHRIVYHSGAPRWPIIGSPVTPDIFNTQPTFEWQGRVGPDDEWQTIVRTTELSVETRPTLLPTFIVL